MPGCNTYQHCLDETNGILCKLLVSWDTHWSYSPQGWRGAATAWCVFVVGVVLCIPSMSMWFCLFICLPNSDLGGDEYKHIRVHALVNAAHSYSIKYDVDALIMDVSSSWRGRKALIYTHRFPGIFMGLAKCHYTAGGEVMNCNKLWCGWVCVSPLSLAHKPEHCDKSQKNYYTPTTCHLFKCIRYR